ncbi:50S ribosomal protein L23 [Desulfovibrionales bacterium]
MESTQVLLRPLISEKSTGLKELRNQVAFLVHSAANKIDVQRAVESVFGVHVTAVNMVQYRPRSRTKFGRAVGKIRGYKKAYVSLAHGDKIDFFEGV